MKCKYGYTLAELQEIILDMEDFDRWMRGQTMMLCEGRRFNHETREYEDDCPEPHGAITFAHDVDRYLRKLPIID